MEEKKNIVLITNSSHSDERRASVFTQSLGTRYAFTVVDLGQEQSDKLNQAKPALVIDLRHVDAEDIDWLVRNVGSKVRKIVYNPQAELRKTLAPLGIETMDTEDLMHAIQSEETNILDGPKDKSTTD